MGNILAAQGKVDAAHDAFAEALRYAWATGPRLFVSGALEGLARVSLEGEKATEAVKFIGGAAALRAEMGTPVRPIDKPALESMLTSAQTLLGAETFARIRAEIQTQPLDRLLSMISLTLPSNKTI